VPSFYNAKPAIQDRGCVSRLAPHALRAHVERCAHAAVRLRFRRAEVSTKIKVAELHLRECYILIVSHGLKRGWKSVTV
jgi:hypothetical protein